MTTPHFPRAWRHVGFSLATAALVSLSPSPVWAQKGDHGKDNKPESSQNEKKDDQNRGRPEKKGKDSNSPKAARQPDAKPRGEGSDKDGQGSNRSEKPQQDEETQRPDADAEAREKSNPRFDERDRSRDRGPRFQRPEDESRPNKPPRDRDPAQARSQDDASPGTEENPPEPKAEPQTPARDVDLSAPSDDAEKEVKKVAEEVEKQIESKKLDIDDPEEAERVIQELIGERSRIGEAERQREDVRGPRSDFRRGNEGERDRDDAGDRPANVRPREETVAEIIRQLRGGATPEAQRFEGSRDDDRDRDRFDGNRRDGDRDRDRYDGDRGDDRNRYADDRDRDRYDNDRDRDRYDGDRDRDWDRDRDRDRYDDRRRYSHPPHLHDGRRYVHYRNRSDIPAILLAAGVLNRIAVNNYRDANYYSQFDDRYDGYSTYRPVDPLPVDYRDEDSYVVSYPVDTSSMLNRDDILFRQGSTQFADDYSYEIVLTMAQAMRDPSLRGERFVVEGHASAEGDYDYNMRLSQQRAERIVREIVREGVDPDRLIPVGYGESEARFPADSPEYDRRQDRRVMVFRLQQ